MSSKFGAFIFLILFIGFIAFSGSSKVDPDKSGFNICPGDSLGVIISHNYVIISKPIKCGSPQCMQNIFIKTTEPDSTMGPVNPPMILYSLTRPPDTQWVAYITCINCK